MSRAQAVKLPDGRLHLNHGPIDLIIACDGGDVEVMCAEEKAIARFASILDELCAELALLRRPMGELPKGIVAQRMWRAAAPFAADHFITPMAAVAGAVAEEVLSAMTAAAPLARAMVNNGGDIAIHLAPGQHYRAGLLDRPDRPALFATAEISAGDHVRGVATSGWRGRSFSLGIADAVTVLARSASVADAAATLIANAVDLPGHPAIKRAYAHDLQPDSDLGARLVTTDVGRLTPQDIATALASGAARAQAFLDGGLICACALHLAGQTRVVATRADGATIKLDVASSRRQQAAKLPSQERRNLRPSLPQDDAAVIRLQLRPSVQPETEI